MYTYTDTHIIVIAFWTNNKSGLSHQMLELNGHMHGGITNKTGLMIWPPGCPSQLGITIFATGIFFAGGHWLKQSWRWLVAAPGRIKDRFPRFYPTRVCRFSPSYAERQVLTPRCVDFMFWNLAGWLASNGWRAGSWTWKELPACCFQFCFVPGHFSADRHLEIANLKKKTGVKNPYVQTDPNNRRIPIIDDWSSFSE